MDPYLLILDENLLANAGSWLASCERDTPVDILVIGTEGTNLTYRYCDPANLSNELEILINDYRSILVGSPAIVQTYSIPENFLHAVIDFNEGKVTAHKSLQEDLMRFWSRIGLQIFYHGREVHMIGVTLAELEEAADLICLNNRKALDELLRIATPILCHFTFSRPLNLNKVVSSQASLQVYLKRITLDDLMALADYEPHIFYFIKPTLELWICAQPYATQGSLTYDLQKLLKEVNIPIEAVRSCVLSTESAQEEATLSFLETFSLNNELELTFKIDTMREEIEELAKAKGRRLLASRASKTSHLVLVST